jgi:ParB family transcriptional regulator, chromosome partitioning protein
MRMPWLKSKGVQLDLAGLDPEPDDLPSSADAPSIRFDPSSASVANDAPIPVVENPLGRAARVAIHLLDEDSSNPRTEFPETELQELTEDIREHGILQPIVVHAADGNGRHLIHFGAKRLRAAERAGMTHVPIVIRDLPADPYAQVAENQKRHGLTPLDLARFIKSRGEAGDSNATIAKRLGMNPTSVAHHLALLELPPELDQALKDGRCTSPRTLHELSKLHHLEPERVRALVAGPAEITRTAVTAVRANAASTSWATLLAQSNAACTRLEQTLARLNKAEHEDRDVDLVALRQRIADLASRLT